MEKEKMNERGIIQIVGLAYIIAAIIVLALLAAIWLFWKPLFLFGIGVAVLFFAFTTIPQMVKGKQGLKYVGITAIAGFALVLLSLTPALLPFSIIGGGNVRYDVENGIAIVSPTKPLVVLTGYNCGNDVTCYNQSYYIRLSIGDYKLTSTCIAQEYGASTAPFVGTPCTVNWSVFNEKGKTGKQTVKMEVAMCEINTGCSERIQYCENNPQCSYTGGPMIWNTVGNIDVLVDNTNCLDNPNCQIGICQSCPTCPVYPTPPGCPTCPTPDYPTIWDWILSLFGMK